MKKKLGWSLVTLIAFSYAMPLVAMAYMTRFNDPDFKFVAYNPDFEFGSFLGQLLDRAKREPRKTLWSFYPASVRGSCLPSEPGALGDSGW